MAPLLVHLKVLLTTFSMAPLFWALDRVAPQAKGQPVLRRGFAMDLALNVLGFLVSVPIAQALGRALAAHCFPGGVSPLRWTWLATQGPGTQALVALVLLDLLGYWLHRWFHTRRIWRFHALHHSAAEMDWLTTGRNHPVDTLLSVVPRVFTIQLLGLSPGVPWTALPVQAFLAHMNHANLTWDYGPLRWVLVSPRLHRWHHTRDPAARDKNFASTFAFLDLLFGTFYLPPDAEPVELGTRDPAYPVDDLGAALALAFKP